ncbi:MAG TPA: hypothetical protein VN580_12890 [Clostridia bacterium]|nr:hypothetical protein [Clostridia bacterium]
MDRKILRNLKKVLVLESIFTGAASLSRVFDETGDELDEMIRYVDNKFQLQKAFDGKLFKKEKH